MQNSDLWTSIQVSMCTRPHLSFCAYKPAWLAPEILVSRVPAFIFGFVHENSDFRTRLTSLYGSQTSSVVLSAKNSVLSTRIKRLYWFQPSPVVLCMQNGDFSIWITSLYWFQPSSVVLYMKIANLGPALQVCMGPRPHLWLWALITACLVQE